MARVRLESLGQHPARNPSATLSSDLANDLLIKPSIGSVLSVQNHLPFFANHVLCVVCVRSRKEVVRPYTIPDIALVANEESYGDGAKVDNPGQAMGYDSRLPAIRKNLYRKATVTVLLRDLPFPLPTTIGLLNFSPEPSQQIVSKLYLCKEFDGH